MKKISMQWLNFLNQLIKPWNRPGSFHCGLSSLGPAPSCGWQLATGPCTHALCNKLQVIRLSFKEISSPSQPCDPRHSYKCHHVWQRPRSPVCSLCSSAQQYHCHRELCSSSCPHQNFKSACADQEHPSADRSSTMGSSTQMNSSEVRLRKKSLQQDSDPSYRVKFRNPLEKERIHSAAVRDVASTAVLGVVLWPHCLTPSLLCILHITCTRGSHHILRLSSGIFYTTTCINKNSSDRSIFFNALLHSGVRGE